MKHLERAVHRGFWFLPAGGGGGGGEGCLSLVKLPYIYFL